MSESSGEKTEEPTDKKIRDARKKGQVAKSQDVSSTALLIIMFVYLAIAKNFYIERITNLVTLPTRFYDAPFSEALPEVLWACLLELIILVVPMLMLVAASAVAVNFLQVGPLLTFEPLKPDLNKLNPVQGAKKIFSIKGLIEILKSIVKIAFLGYLVYRVIRAVIDSLLKVPYAEIGAVVSIMGPIMKAFTINVCVAYVIVAVLDFFFQKQQHTKELRMTKDEVKREFKEMEGDPLIKGERKQLHQELAMNDTVQSTKKASALVTNPEHVAVAIFYNEDAVKLPVVIAKGKDHVAQMMIKAAEEEGIPVLRNINLARGLYATDEYNYVPSEFIEPVAAVLKWAAEVFEGGAPDYPEL